ncbi:ATP-binding protein [Streptomyces sp. SCA2-2]|uniref:uridine kinase family protein n=1 Tax=Streptomyces sp. SCA2-2 TaxID=1563677 RepID=UPI00101EAD86|nr:ATP-binding protein [Streptomyces sp. SCA2-2]RZE95841.1 ATP-binding protein [Streptomyces sp. SCA2-2]
MSSLSPIPTRVVLLTGPSGSGKTSLAAHSGLPVLALDDFYKEAGDPTLPLLPATGETDWDSPLSWDSDAALDAIESLCRRGRARVPVYDIGASARAGESTLDIDRTPLFIAEGIFAADLVERCRERGLLADALCLHGHPTTTFRRRLARDLREARKPLPVLLRRGWRLLRAERAIIARQSALGAHPCTREEALCRLAAAAAGRHVTARGAGPARTTPVAESEATR